MSEIENSIILSFAESDMRAAKTARKLNYHRNSIIYHLKCIRNKYGLDPQRFYDLVELVKIAKGGEV